VAAHPLNYQDHQRQPFRLADYYSVLHWQ
jgi:hypothetical protein